MSAFSFNTTYQPTGDQQKDAIAQIGIMQNRAVQANLAYQSCRDSGALFKVLHQVNNDAYSALFDHGLASKSDQRFASIRSTGNLTFSTAF